MSGKIRWELITNMANVPYNNKSSQPKKSLKEMSSKLNNKGTVSKRQSAKDTYELSDGNRGHQKTSPTAKIKGKKSFKEKVKEKLPSKKTYENKKELNERSNMQDNKGSRGVSRKEYVAKKKAKGETTKPTYQVKKGWGSKNPKYKVKEDK